MPKILVCGRGGSGKSTLVTMLARVLGEQGKVLVVDKDESNLGLWKMMDISPPETLMDSLGGQEAVMRKLMPNFIKKGIIEKLRPAFIKNKKSKGTAMGLKMFPEEFSIDELPAVNVSWDGRVGLLQIGKIEHSNGGCSCPMAILACDILNNLNESNNEWVMVDTEAGIEHFGQGVCEGVDAVLMIVDPSHEAILLAEKTAILAEEVGKAFSVVLNKVDDKTEPCLIKMLEALGIDIAGVLHYSPEISEANLMGKPLKIESLRWQLENIIIHLPH
ncbi:MAG: nitrogenase reductase [Fastidiosipilaceae bacterium]